MRLSVLALLQGLLCLTASSRAFQIPDEDRDYELVKEIAHKYYKEQRAEANRRGQEEEDMAPVVVLLAPNTDGEDPGNIKGQEEIPNDPIMIYLDIPGAMSEDGQDEQEEREQDLAREIEINETIDQVSAMNEQLFMMSVLAHRLSELFEKEMVQGESDVNVPAEEQTRGDLKKTEDLVKEDKQPTAKMAGDANGWGLSKKEVGLSQAIEPRGYKEIPSNHRIFSPDNVGSPAPRENIYENNEDMSNDMIVFVNPEEHQMYMLDFDYEETSPRQKNKAPTGDKDFFFDKTDGKREDNFDQSIKNACNTQQDDNETPKKDTDFEGNKKELGESSFLSDFLAFLRKLPLGKDGGNMADSENTHVNDLPSVIPKAKETGSSKAENKV